MIEFDTRHLALLCAGQFIAHFDYADLTDCRYCSEYETTLSGTALCIDCRAQFDKRRESIENFTFDVESEDNDNPISIKGSMREAGEHARRLINAYLENYRNYCPQEF